MKHNPIHKAKGVGQGQIASKEVITNAFETVELIKKLYQFDRVASLARKFFGIRIKTEEFEELERKRKAIESAMDEYIELGRKLKLIKK